MSNDSENAWADLANQQAWKDVRSYVEGIVSDHKEYPLADAEALDERIHETSDGAIIYTRDQYLYAFGLRDADDVDDGSGSTFEALLTWRAYANLREAIATHPDIEALREKLETGEKS